MRSKAYSTSLEVIARLTGGPNLRPDLSLKVYVKPSLEIVGSAVARSGCSSLPFAPAVWLVATSVRSSALYIVNALARYSPVGSKALVNPKSSCAVRSTPPFWTPPVEVPPPPPPPPPQAAAIRAIARASPTMPIQRRLLPIIPRLSTEGSSPSLVSLRLGSATSLHGREIISSARSVRGRHGARRLPG